VVLLIKGLYYKQNVNKREENKAKLSGHKN
jgi:hypothetical protein